MRSLIAATTLLASALLPSCGYQEPAADPALKGALGLKPAKAEVSVVAEGLTNPSGVAFDDRGRLTICDSGNGVVLLANDGEITTQISGFDTEYWKVDAETGARRFKLGPLSAVWLPDGRLAVSDAGKKDGEDRILVFDGGKTEAKNGKASNGIPSTTGQEGDLGEGNPTGMALSHDGETVWVCGQGTDLKSWILSFDPKSMTLATWASSDDEGIAVNSPMQILVWDADHILVLYSGTGGEEDGLVAKWNVRTKKPVAKWTLPGLVDPMGMARVPGSDALMVVDNNWALTEVKDGKLARVTLGEGNAAKVEVLADKLRGPVSCAYGPDGRLYVAELGREFDKNFGRVLAFKGL